MYNCSVHVCVYHVFTWKRQLPHDRNQDCKQKTILFTVDEITFKDTEEYW